MMKQVDTMFGSGISMGSIMESVGNIGGTDTEYNDILNSLAPEDDPWTQDEEVNEDDLPEEEEELVFEAEKAAESTLEETIMSQVDQAITKEDQK